MKFFPAAFNRIARALDVLWGTPTNGQVFTYDSSLQKAKWANAGVGDMLKSTYDADNNGVVDNASALGGQAASHYLNRANHTGTQSAGTITGLANVATSGSASDLGTGTLPIARIGAGTVTDDKLAVSYLPDQSDPGSGTFAASGKLLFYDGTLVTGLTGPSTARKRLASNASGVVEWRDEHKPVLAGTVRDLMLITTNPVAWKAGGVDIDAGGRLLASETLTSGEASLQTFTLRTSFLRIPDGFLAFKTTGAFTFSLLADDTDTTDAVLTGYTVTGYTDRESTGTTLLTASGLTIAVSSTNIPDVVSVDRSAFSSTTVPSWVVIEFELSVRSSKCIVVTDYGLYSE